MRPAIVLTAHFPLTKTPLRPPGHIEFDAVKVTLSEMFYQVPILCSGMRFFFALLTRDELGYLAPLDTQTRHQPFLVEKEGINSGLNGARRKRTSGPFIHHDNGRTYTDFGFPPQWRPPISGGRSRPGRQELSSDRGVTCVLLSGLLPLPFACS